MYIVEDDNLLQFWDWDTNKEAGLLPEKITTKSRTMANWKCKKCGQSFVKQVRDMNKCPFCTGHRVKKGVNDIATTNPEVLNDWDYENNTIKPTEITKGSHKKVSWLCGNGHQYKSMVKARIQGEGCPFCANKIPIKGVNDLGTVNSYASSLWNYDKNDGKNPSDYLPNSKKRVWWKCEEGHEWVDEITKMNNSNKCPYCYPRATRIKHGVFVAEHPHLSSEWDYSKNTENIENLTSSSNKKVYWVCEKGHSWRATISDRCRGYNCPECSKELRVSFPEKAILYYVNKYFEKVEGNYKSEWLGNYEIDVFIPDFNIGIEYDGNYGHNIKNSVDRDLRKNKLCEKNGVTLIRIRENDCPDLNSTSIDFKLDRRNSPKEAIFAALNETFKITNYDKRINLDDIDLYSDYQSIQNLISITKKNNSLSEKNPELIKYWNFEKNKNMLPEHVTFMSSKKAWWRCKKGHEWIRTVSNMVRSPSCPYCSGKKVLEGYNDISTKNPILAQEWDPIKNSLKPSQVTAGSGKKIWWICNKGHSWEATIVSRNRGNGCPICSNRVLLKGYNDVAHFPDLLKIWNYDKNKELPDEVRISCQRKKWWKCNVCGNEWQAIPRRTSCPKCSKMKRKTKHI